MPGEGGQNGGQEIEGGELEVVAFVEPEGFEAELVIGSTYHEGGPRFPGWS